MKPYTIDTLIERYPVLEACKADILSAHSILEQCFLSNGKLLIAGNGGSCSDADHIVGELMKSFKMKRPIDPTLSMKLKELDSERGEELSIKLEQGLPAIALHHHQALNTAFNNAVPGGGLLTYAEQVLTYGNEGDVFLGISTSGNSESVYNAALVAKAKGLSFLLLSGRDGGKLKRIADVSIVVPAEETFQIQEYHLPIYHLLCLMLERRFFGEEER